MSISNKCWGKRFHKNSKQAQRFSTLIIKRNVSLAANISEELCDTKTRVMMQRNYIKGINYILCIYNILF